MALVLLFAVLLILSFAVLLYFLKPTPMEKAVSEQLADIGGVQTSSAQPTTILKEAALHSNPLIEDLVRRIPWSPAVSRLIKQAGKGWRVSSVLALSSLAALVAGWLAWSLTSQSIVVLCSALAAGLSPYVVLYILREMRFNKFDALLPEAVDLMSRGLRAGHSISAVMEMVGTEVGDPVGIEFSSVNKEQSLGLPIREAIMNLVERVPIDDLRFLATAILLQKESGGNLVQILDKTSAVLRERARLRGQLRIYTAQGRISGWILCAAPFIMFGLISITNYGYEKPLFHTPLGIKMVYGGLALMVVGILFIRKIIDVKV
jgi:tight adherence protein B